MIIELPEKFNYGNQAKIFDGILYVPSGVSWREFMYKLTLACKGKQCYYCGRKLKKEEITMDHLYPQDLGGPTIPNNLAPCCTECNTKKGCLTEQQFRQITSAPEDKKKEIKSRFWARNDEHKSKKGYFLPKQWIITRKVETVIVPFYLNENYTGKKYSKIGIFYEHYQKIPYPIVIDRKGFLLDGFLVLMFAKNNNIQRVPTIVLENVEVVI